MKKERPQQKATASSKPRPNTFKPYTYTEPIGAEDIARIRSCIESGNNPLPCIPYGAMHPGLTDQDIIDLVQINDHLFPSYMNNDWMV